VKKKILIVGGTGFIGYHVAKKSKSKNWDVTIISTKKPKIFRKIKNAKYLKCDISNKKQVIKTLKDKNFHYVVNLGGYVDHGNKKKTFLSHYNGCKNLADHFSKKTIRSFVQVGSGGEYGNLRSPHSENSKCNPKSIYSKAKYLSTKYLTNLHKKKNFPCTIIRLYQVYGPKQDLNRFISITISNCLKNKKFPSSEGKQFRDFTYIDDIVEAIFKVFKTIGAKGKILNIGTGKPLNIKNTIINIQKECKGGFPMFGKIKLRKEENLETYPNIAKARKIIKWKPKISFLKGIKYTIKSYEK
jgi:nucleoside-diphosphate-sugar epimerase